MITPGVRDLPPATNTLLMTAVRIFSDFNADNDPHQEHDFSSIEIDGQKYFWKIDYYDATCEYGSADPSDPALSERL